MFVKKINIPAQGRNKDYKFLGGQASITNVGGGGGFGIGGSWLEQFFTYDVETDEMTFTKSLAVQGSLYQQGSAYETHVEHLFSKNDFIILREDAVSALPSNQLSGFKILKANGTVNLIFGAGNDAIGRIGWEGGSLQAIATRADTPTNNGIAVWNNAISRFDTPYLVSDFPRKAENAVISGAWNFNGKFFVKATAAPSTEVFYVNGQAAFGNTIRVYMDAIAGSPSGSQFVISTPGGNPGFVFYRGNGSGGVERRYDFSVTSTGIRLFDNTGGHTLFQSNHSGHLGIGINAPTEKLEVAGNLKLNTLSAVNGTFSDIIFNGSSDNLGANPTARIRFTRTASGALGNISFQVRRSDNFTTAERMLISNDEVLFHTRINSPTFISGFAGSGWRLDATDNHLTVDKLTVRGQINVYELILNKIRATNGSLWVSDAFEVGNVYYSTTWNQWVLLKKQGDTRAFTFEIGDIVKAQEFDGNNVRVFVGQITYKDGTQLSIAPLQGDAWNNMTVVRIGHVNDTNRQGALYLTSSDNEAPYMDVLDGVNSASLSGKTRLRIGKLSGISGQSGYGIWGSRDGANEAFVISSNGYARIAGWSFTNNQLVSPTVGGGFIQMSVDGYPRIQVYRNEDNRVNIYHYSSTDWGIAGRKDGAWVFRLGGINQIAGCNFNAGSIWSTGEKWKLNADGSGRLAGGLINWTADGNMTIDKSLIADTLIGNVLKSENWDASGGVYGSNFNLSDGTARFGQVIRIDSQNGGTIWVKDVQNDIQGVKIGNFALSSIFSGGSSIDLALIGQTTTPGTSASVIQTAYITSGGMISTSNTNFATIINGQYTLSFGINVGASQLNNTPYQTINTSPPSSQSSYSFVEAYCQATIKIYLSNVVIYQVTESFRSTPITLNVNHSFQGSGTIKIEISLTGYKYLESGDWIDTNIFRITRNGYIGIIQKASDRIKLVPTSSVTEISTKGFLSLWGPSKYFRIMDVIGDTPFIIAKGFTRLESGNGNHRIEVKDNGVYMTAGTSQLIQFRYGTWTSDIDTQKTVYFATPFPNACLVVVTDEWSGNPTILYKDRFVIDRHDSVDGILTRHYIAIGY